MKDYNTWHVSPDGQRFRSDSEKILDRYVDDRDYYDDAEFQALFEAAFNAGRDSNES